MGVKLGMMFKSNNLLIVVMLFCFVGFFKAQASELDHYYFLKQKISNEFGTRTPKEWAQYIKDVKNKLSTDKKVIALTFDACGSPGDGYDAPLIDYLIANKIPATLFVTAHWIDKNPEVFKSLAANPLFEIENHGFMHKPCSVDGKEAYGIKGTRNVGEVVDEVEKCALKISRITGKKPLFYRSGTAYYDDVAVMIIKHLGYTPAGFSVLGDAGATYQLWEVKDALLSAKEGDIYIFHMNHPGSNALAGIKEALPVLKKRGFKFVRLADDSAR